MFTRIITTFIFIFLGLSVQHAYAQIASNAAMPPGDLIYQHTFDTNPEWTTDQPENFYWDAEEKALFVRTNNKNEDHTPNRYFYTETNLDPTKSFILTWDVMPLHQMVYGHTAFGIHADDLTMDNTSSITSSSTFNVEYGVGINDRSMINTMNVYTEDEFGGSSYDSPFVVLENNVWYTVRAVYDASADKSTYTITERDSGEVVLPNGGRFSMNGAVFSGTMKNLGIAMYPTGHETDNGQAKNHPDRFLEAYIDNVSLFGSFDESELPTLTAPSLHHPLDTTLIQDGQTITHNTVTASAIITDPQGSTAQLELELKKTTEPLDGTNTVLSGTTTTSITIDELIPKDEHYTQGGNTATFHYRMRAKTEDGRTSAWTEPHSFTTKVVPLFTQVESNYPIVLEGEHWAEKTFASGKGNYTRINPATGEVEKGCGLTFAQCACAVASLTMLGHYYDIRTGVDGEALNPFTMDAWLLAHDSYTSIGGVWWSSALAYMGVQQDGEYASRLTHDHIGITNRNLVDTYLTAHNPAIVYNKAKLHYFVLDGKIGDTYTVRDPAWYNTVTLNDTLGQTRVQAYGNTFNSAHLFGFHDAPQPVPAYIQAQLASPAELVIIAPDGNRLGFDPVTNTQYEEIPGGTYSLEGSIGDPESTDTPPHDTKNIHIPNPIEGAYTLKVIGTDTGSYTLSTRITDSALNGTSTTHVKDTTIGHTDTYQLTFDSDGTGFSVRTIDQLLTELRTTVYNTPAASLTTMVTIRSKADAAHEHYAAGNTQQTIKTLKELKTFVKDNTSVDITPAQADTIVTQIKALLVLLKS